MMKHLLPIAILALIIQFIPSVSFSQTAVGGCSSATITSQNFDKKLIESAQPHVIISQCHKIVTPIKMGHAVIHLQKMNENTGVFEDVAGPFESRIPPSQSSSTTFGTVTINTSVEGTYRGRVNVPITFMASCGPILYDGLTSTNIGRQAVIGSDMFTNVFVIGQTTQSDIDVDITDINGFPQSNFDDNDQVLLDLSESTNFNRYFIAIQQVSGSNNYQSAGWQNGTPSTINLNDIWTQTFSSWKFWNNRNFRVQVVLENVDCPNGVWNQKFEFFNTCSGGSGTCRFAHEADLAVFPNPATDMFVVRHLELSKDVKHDLLISDASGRVVRNERLTGSQVDISDLEPGFYVVRIDEDGENVLSTKLVVK
jgi:hypothetical protein